MKTSINGLSIRHAGAAILIAAVAVLCAAALSAQAEAAKRTALMAQQELLQLPYYGVFDYLAVGVQDGVAIVGGYAYQAKLKSDAAAALTRVSGVEEVVNTIDVLPASQNDDRIRWDTFSRIYTDEFLSRYAPGGAIGARYEARSSARFPGMQPFGRYPIHIVVKNGRTTLLGVVDHVGDKTLASVKAREVTGVFNVENDLVVDRR